jgi:hypothetical protein
MNTEANTDQRAYKMPAMPNLCSSIFEGSSLPTAMLAGAKHVVRYANPAFGRLLLIWLTQQTAMGSVERCLGRHFPRPCGSSKATSLPRKRANSTSRPAAGLMASSVRAVKIGELTSW